MSYGFEAINNNNKIIINDKFENYHFAGKATFQSVDGSGLHDSISGSTSAYLTFLGGRTVYTYTFTTAGTPLVFIRPKEFQRHFALIRQSQSGSTWTFEVLVEGGINLTSSTRPELYCFVNADDTDLLSEDHGLIVKKADGTTRTFDSRHLPLAIIGGGTHKPPVDPTESAGLPSVTTGHAWNHQVNDHDFRTDSQYNSYGFTGTYSDLMIAAPSMAQAVYKRQMEGYKQSCGFGGTGCQDHYSTAIWWVMYRNTFKLRNNFLDSGWTVYSSGYAFSSVSEGGGWFGGGGGSYSTGTMPYSAKTINHHDEVYILADATRYD